ncbi:MAG: hypothetical protein OXI77_04355 [Chloroflexota bacterium]|nr:hypothetical protein [Chloroflexota bacterium]MDE2908444.1 hypothetical protein [Chloroflexota bacterium]
MDNCCFVDRQCSSDQQWADGYNAFQNKQCSAPGPAPAAASPPAASQVLLRTANAVVIGDPHGHSILPSTSKTFDWSAGSVISYSNFCQGNWQCNSASDWAAGHHAFRSKQCGLPGRVISLVGDAEFQAFYTRRLEELERKLPHRYDYVLRGLDKVEQDACQPSCSFGVNTDIATFLAYWYPLYVNGWEKRESAILAHEACHVHRDRARGFYRSPTCDPNYFWSEETICRELELEVVIELGAPSHVIEGVRNMLANTRARSTGEVPCPVWEE